MASLQPVMIPTRSRLSIVCAEKKGGLLDIAAARVAARRKKCVNRP